MNRMLFLALFLSAIFLSGGGSGEQAPHIIHFKEGTTYQEAATLLAPFAQPAQPLIFQWAYPNEMTTLSGPIYYAENQDINQLRSDHWRAYYGMVLADIAIAQEVIAEAETPHPNTVQYLETLQNVKADLDNTILNCWDQNKCPTVLVRQIRMVVSQEMLDQIQSSPMVETVKDPATFQNSETATSTVPPAHSEPLHIDDFAPQTVDLTITSTQGVTSTREITQVFIWNFDDNPFPFNNQMAYSQILWLNDSDTSMHGPGTYLDDAQDFFSQEPSYAPSTNFSNFFVQSRGTDLDFEKRFGVTMTNPQNIIGGIPYRITWTTPPGDADIDNGNIQMILEDKSNPDCAWGFCSFPRLSCHIFDALWGIDPIEDGQSYPFNKPYEKCVESSGFFFQIYIPFLTASE